MNASRIILTLKLHIGDVLLKVGIITNDDQTIQFLSKEVAEYGLKKLVVSKSVVFRSVKKFLNSEDEFDILFVDTGKDTTTSVESAKMIRQAFPKITLIIISNNQSDVLDAFPVRAYRFLVKPISTEMIDEALDSFRRDQFSEKYVIGKTKTGYRTFCMDEIHYVMADGKHSIIYLEAGEFRLSTPFSQMVEQLSDEAFFVSSRSFIVNMQFVLRFNSTEIILLNGEQVPLSRRRKMDFYIKYNEYIKTHTFK